MKKDKEVSLEELENVNGGGSFHDANTFCPKCKKYFDGNVDNVTRGEGCDEKKYKKCPYCGNEFE